IPARGAVIRGQSDDGIGAGRAQARPEEVGELAAGPDLVVEQFDETESLDHVSSVAARLSSVYVGAIAAATSQRDTPETSAASMPAATAPAMSVSSWSPIITVRSGATPSRRHASANTCGSGLPRCVKR